MYNKTIIIFRFCDTDFGSADNIFPQPELFQISQKPCPVIV